MKAGIGSAAIVLPDGLVVGAIVAVNAVGDIIDSGNWVRSCWRAQCRWETRRCAQGASRRCAHHAAQAWRAHDACHRGDERETDKGAGEPHGVDGRRWAGARVVSVTHAGGRRHGVRARNRRLERKRRRQHSGRAGRGHVVGGDRPRCGSSEEFRRPAVGCDLGTIPARFK